MAQRGSHGAVMVVEGQPISHYGLGGRAAGGIPSVVIKRIVVAADVVQGGTYGVEVGENQQCKGELAMLLGWEIT